MFPLFFITPSLFKPLKLVRLPPLPNVMTEVTDNSFAGKYTVILQPNLALLPCSLFLSSPVPHGPHSTLTTLLRWPRSATLSRVLASQVDYV